MKKPFLTLLLSFFAIACFGQVPRIIPYQGQISDTSGKAYDGNYDFTFEILDNSNALLWSSGSRSIAVYKGVYSVHLGESPQPALPQNLMDNDLLYLRISFNDGVNGVETLSPNVQILPVPYALRSVIADSAVRAPVSPGWGDSLVLRDQNGDVRFVLNPNTGEFNILRDDTLWHQLKSNSPTVETRNFRGGRSKRRQTMVSINGDLYFGTEFTDIVGTNYLTVRKNSAPKQRFDTFEISRSTDRDGCKRYEEIRVRDTLTNVVREYRTWYNCPGGSIRGFKCENISGGAAVTVQNEETNTKTEEGTKDGKKEETTEDLRSGNKVKVTSDAKDSCYVIEANKLVLKRGNHQHEIKIDANGIVSTSSDDQLANKGVSQTQRVDGDTLKVAWKARPGSPPFTMVTWGNEPGAPRSVFDRAGKKETQTGIKDMEVVMVDTSFSFLFRDPTQNKLMQVTFIPLDSLIHRNGIKGTRTETDENGYVSEFRYDPNENVVRLRMDPEENKVELEEVAEFWKTNEWIRHVRRMEQGKTVEVVYDRVSNSDSAKKEVNPAAKSETSRGITLDTRQLVLGDTFISEVQELDAGDNIVRRATIRFAPRDSTIIYDGYTRRANRVGNRGFVSTYEFDGGSNMVRETTNPRDSSRVISGIKEHIYDSRDLVFTGVANGSDVVGTTFDPANKKVVNQGANVYEYDMGNNVVIVERTTGAKADVLNVDPVSNNVVGLELDPNSRSVHVKGSGNTKVLADTLEAIRKLLCAAFDVNGSGLITGNLNVLGNISKGGGSFRIDHPQDPYNKYLYHSFVESPDMMNVYNGNTTTDSAGLDTVFMPSYFRALNREFRYQLTCIGTFAQAIILKELENNWFVIQTNKPGVKVSWQVTGIRKDPFAEENRIPVEVDKEPSMKGKLLYPPKQKN